MSATATAMLNVCRSQLGFREGPNNDTPYGAWYGLNHEPYCAMGLSWAAMRCNALDIMYGRWASCPRWLAAFKAHGQFLPWTATVQPGDIAFFDWTGSHDYPQHVGIVESGDSQTLVTIEFNTTSGAGDQSDGGGVWRRRRNRSTVAGFGRPLYARQSTPTRSGSRSLPLVIDGVWGPLTTAKLQTWLGTPSTGTLTTNDRRALQRRIGVTADGEWGPITHRALQRYLHVAADGIWGPITIKALQRFLNQAVS